MIIPYEPPDKDEMPIPQVRINAPSATRAWRPDLAISAAAREQTRPTSSPVAAVGKLLTFDRVTTGLIHLYPRFVLRDMLDMRVALGAPVSAASERGYDALPSHIRNEVNQLVETPGPKTWLVSISRGHISPYNDLLTSGTPRRIIARSLYSICKAAIEHGCFAWEDAEREFGIKLRGVPRDKHYIDISVADWGKGRTTSTSTSSLVIASC